tara:strand:- start:1865 stop:2095 length:231 start_codon:yes stop_codon:yes gene_type:complete
MTDNIYSPNHYQQGELETWDAIIGLDLGYLEGNVVKYLSRYKHKEDPLGDLYKAKAYVEKLIELQIAEIADVVSGK